MLVLAMISGGRCARLGYDLGYLRHGSFDRAAPYGPAGCAAWPACAAAMGGPLFLVALRWRASLRASYGLDAGADGGATAW